MSLVHMWGNSQDVAASSFSARGALVVVPLLGLYLFGEALWALRRPAGLSISADGMLGVRGGPRVDLTWLQITDVRVTETPKRRSLVLDAGDRHLFVPDRLLGGDVYAIATVVRYYLVEPDERHRLSDGIAAIHHVDSEVRARRFISS